NPEFQLARKKQPLPQNKPSAKTSPPNGLQRHRRLLPQPPRISPHLKLTKKNDRCSAQRPIASPGPTHSPSPPAAPTLANGWNLNPAPTSPKFRTPTACNSNPINP